MTEAEWRAQPGPWAHLSKIETDELIAACVAAEREACAKIADDIAAQPPINDQSCVDWQIGYRDGGMKIAAEIRERNAT